MDQQNQKNEKLLNEIGKMKEEMDGNWRVMTKKMEKRMAELMEGMVQKEEENIQLKGENSKLEEKNRAMKRKMERMEAYIPEEKKSLICRPLPAELLFELFGLFPLENAFNLMAKMPNYVLARNIRTRLKTIKTAMKANKWKLEDCGPKLAISHEGLVVSHSVPAGVYNRVRAVLPIPKFNSNIQSIAYFEVELLKRIDQYEFNVVIGFCTKHFPLEGRVDQENLENSIGINSKRRIVIGGSYSNFENAANPYFNTGDVVGIGIVHSPANSQLKCFATCNGKLLGTAKFPVKFADLELFPTVQLFCGNSIRANFGQNEWRFNPEQLRQ